MPDDRRRPGSIAPPAGVHPELFDYLQGSFASLSGQMSTAVRISTQALELGRENEAQIAQLRWHAFGSKGPPPLASPPHREATILGRVTGTEHDVDAAKAEQIIQAHEIAVLKAEVQAQSKAMGLIVRTPDVAGEQPAPPSKAERFAVFITSRSGQSFVLKVLTLVCTILGLAASMRASSSAKDTADKVNGAPIVAPYGERR